jgi:hypothetical protein
MNVRRLPLALAGVVLVTGVLGCATPPLSSIVILNRSDQVAILAFNGQQNIELAACSTGEWHPTPSLEWVFTIGDQAIRSETLDGAGVRRGVEIVVFPDRTVETHSTVGDVWLSNPTDPHPCTGET